MLGPNCWIFLILSILRVSAASDEDDAYCKNGKISVKDVSELISVINDRRTNLASGFVQNEDGRRFPPAKNMRKMAYDCTLEREAESFLDVLDCANTEKQQREYQKGSAFLLYPTSIEVSWSDALNRLLQLDETSKSFSFDENQPVKFMGDYYSLYYANLMRGNASKIGCAAKICSTGNAVKLCLTDERNIQPGDEIYEMGSAENCECDKSFECDGKLCVIPVEFPGISDGPSTWCSSKEISDTMRMHMQDTHNYRRSLLALSQVVNNKGKTLPAASNMNYLDWDCALEKEAHDFLRDCPTDGYLGADDSITAQNFYYGTTNEPTFRDMNKKAVTEWWKQVRKVEGLNVANPVFLSEHRSSGIKSYTLMGWASSRQMGCSIAKCGDHWVEACRYYPPGNEVDKQMYKPGKVCSRCKSEAGPCDSSLGLCRSKK